MNVAVEDIRKVVKAAAKGGRTVVLGGHSLGGTITTAYATWDFNGRAGVDDLAGLVYIDGGSLGGAPPSAEQAQASIDQLNDPSQSPFLDILGLGVPWATGVFNAVGSTAALEAPKRTVVFDGYPLLPSSLKPPSLQATPAGTGTRSIPTQPSNLALVQVHIGSLASSGDPRGWSTASSARSPVPPRSSRASPGWTDGLVSPAPPVDRRRRDQQRCRQPGAGVFGDHATHGDDVDVPIYAFATSLGNTRIIDAAKQLASSRTCPRRRS